MYILLTVFPFFLILVVLIRLYYPFSYSSRNAIMLDIWFDNNTLHLLRYGSIPPFISHKEKCRVLLRSKSFAYIDHKLFKRYANERFRLVPPPNARLYLISQRHSLLGHCGIFKTMSSLRSEYFWSNMSGQVSSFINSCVICKHKNAKPMQKIHLPFESLSYPFQKVALDVTFYPPRLPILTIIDLFSKYVRAFWLDNVSSFQTMMAFRQFCHEVKFPHSLLVDNGSEFQSQFVDFCFLHQIKIYRTKPRHPYTNGCVERCNLTLKQRMKSISLENPLLSLHEVIINAQFAINQSTHCSTNYTPLQVLESRGLLNHRVSCNLEFSSKLRNAYLTRVQMNSRRKSILNLQIGLTVFFTRSVSRLSRKHLFGPAFILLIGSDELILAFDSKTLSMPFSQVWL